MKKLGLIIISILFILPSIDAQTVSGKVFGVDEKGKKTPLPGVNIYWVHNLDGTITDVQGKFEIVKDGKPEEDNHDEHLLVFSYIGYQKDTIHVHGNMNGIRIHLTPTEQLEGVEVQARRKGASISRMDPILTQNISSAELTKAACCNLSESFETNASVDVHYSDAVTGAKQIQLLGLAGTYTQLMTENIPNYYGLANSFGLMYVPGTWMESIQVSKGAAAVVNGYESMTGQINVE